MRASSRPTDRSGSPRGVAEYHRHHRLRPLHSADYQRQQLVPVITRVLLLHSAAEATPPPHETFVFPRAPPSPPAAAAAAAADSADYRRGAVSSTITVLLPPPPPVANPLFSRIRSRERRTHGHTAVTPNPSLPFNIIIIVPY